MSFPIKSLRSGSDFVVVPDPNTIYDSAGIRLVPDMAYVTITGILVSSPHGYPGRFGDRVTFLYNGRMEENEWNGFLFLPPDTIYKVGPAMINDWAFVGVYDDMKAVVWHSQRFPQGAHVLINPRYAHRLDPGKSDSALAIKDDYILMEMRIF